MAVNVEANLRNFKDFLQIYNTLSEKCFKRCINSLNTRTLEDDEMKCVDNCSEKFVKLNHRFMALYMERQQVIVNRRIKEVEAEEEAKRAQAKQELSIEANNLNTVVSTEEQTKLADAKQEQSTETNNSYTNNVLTNSDSVQQPNEVVS